MFNIKENRMKWNLNDQNRLIISFDSKLVMFCVIHHLAVIKVIVWVSAEKFSTSESSSRFIEKCAISSFRHNFLATFTPSINLNIVFTTANKENSMMCSSYCESYGCFICLLLYLCIGNVVIYQTPQCAFTIYFTFHTIMSVLFGIASLKFN